MKYIGLHAVCEVVDCITLLSDSLQLIVVNITVTSLGLALQAQSFLKRTVYFSCSHGSVLLPNSLDLRSMASTCYNSHIVSQAH